MCIHVIVYWVCCCRSKSMLFTNIHLYCCAHTYMYRNSHWIISVHICIPALIIPHHFNATIICALLSSRVTVNPCAVHLYHNLSSCCALTQFALLHVHSTLLLYSCVCSADQVHHVQNFMSSHVCSVWEYLCLCSSSSTSVFAKMKFCSVYIIVRPLSYRIDQIPQGPLTVRFHPQNILTVLTSGPCPYPTE